MLDRQLKNYQKSGIKNGINNLSFVKTSDRCRLFTKQNPKTMRHFYAFFILIHILLSLCCSRWQKLKYSRLLILQLTFRDVHVDASGNGWATGTCGTLASTQNNGQDWALGTTPEGLDFDAVTCQPGTDCQTVFLAKDGQVFRSTNGGQSWTAIAVDCSGPRGFAFLDNNTIVLSHSSASLFRSTDGGDSWAEIPLEYTYRDEAHFPTNTIGYVFQQSGGPLLKSTDAGATWDSIYQFDANALYGSWIDENIGFLYDQSRNVFKTTNGGSTWDLVADTGVPGNVRRLVALSETELVAYVFPSSIFRSTDGGVTWMNNSSIGDGQFGLRFEGIHNNGSDFWISSWGTEILYSTDGLETATSQFPADRPNFEAVAFPTDMMLAMPYRNAPACLKRPMEATTWSQISTSFLCRQPRLPGPGRRNGHYSVQQFGSTDY
jgi:photosystem II stability/assembly factor-like uncharacterized protein